MKVKPVSFIVVWEDWNIYRLSDGRTFKLKTPVSRIRLKDAAGEGSSLDIDFETFQRIDGEVELYPPSIDQTIRETDIRGAVRYEIMQERPQLYYLSEIRMILVVKPSISTIRSTTKYDKTGYPIYSTEIQIQVTSVKMT